MGLIQPLLDAVDVETVTTSARNERTVVTGSFTIGTTIVKRVSTYTAVLVFCCPLPGCNAQEAVDLDIHEI